MWAALPLQPLKPNAISIPKPPPRRHHPVAVYNLQNQNREEKGGLGLGGAVITALKTNQPRNPNAAKSNRKPPPAPGKQEERQLSGADVLMALEIVAAQKAKKKKEARDSSKGRNNNNNTNNSAERNRFRDFSNVKPLCIQPDWTGRLEELERRLQQLADI